MPHYFYVIPAGRFEAEIQPALAAAWRNRTFEPCRELCDRLAAAAEGFALVHRIDPDAMFIAQVAAGTPFSKAAWRSLAGDLLMVSASLIPEIQTVPETLCCLLAPDRLRGPRIRRDFAPIEQAHLGSRDLSFHGGFYRPEHAGWNDRADVARLADYLTAIDPRAWTPDQPTPLAEITAEDRQEELEFAKQCLQNLTILYQSGRGHVIVCEEI